MLKRLFTLAATALFGFPVLRAQYVIPLETFPDQHRLGISVRLGATPTPFTYLLDTGSVAFLSARGRDDHPHWAGAYESISTDTFAISYASSLAYQGNVASTALTFQTTTGPLTIADVKMGAINPNEADEPFPGWYAAVNSTPPVAPEPRGGPPLFYGTFGAGLNFTAKDNGDMVSVLNQIPVGEGYTRGFVIQSGGLHSTGAMLTVGLSPETINAFPILLKMNPSTGTYTIGTTTFDLYPQAQATANYSISKSSDTYAQTGNFIMDTGGDNTFLTTGSVINPPDILLNSTKTQIVDGAAFTVQIDGAVNPFNPSINGQPLDWTTNPTGSVAFDNQIQVDPGSSFGSVNSGINLFYAFDVMFDTEHGLIGLRPIPEPTGLANLLGAFLLLGSVLIARRHNASRSRK